MECKINKLLRGKNWECSTDFMTFSSLNSTATGRGNLRSIRLALEGFDIDNDSGYICLTCVDHLKNRRKLICRHPSHTGIRNVDGERRLYYLTAIDAVSKFAHLNLRPNDGICKQTCLEFSTGSQLLDSFKPPKAKETTLVRVNEINTTLGLPPLELGKRNQFGQAKQFSQSVTKITEILTENIASLGLQIPTKISNSEVSQFQKDSEDLKRIMGLLKDRIKDCSTAEKRSLLTLTQ
jgi:hypothetical protein